MAEAAVQEPQVQVRSIGDAKIPYEVLRMIPEESAEHYGIAPTAVADGVLEVGMLDPSSIPAIDALNFISRTTGMPYKVYRISKEDFGRIMSMYRGLHGEVDAAVGELQTTQAAAAAAAPKKHEAESDEEAPLDLEDPSLAKSAGSGDIQEDAPAIKIVSTILRYAIDGRASDVHIEPLLSGVRVRYRVDGELHTSVILPPETQRAVVARIKVLASIRLDERRKPQDGRFSASIENRQIDFRVSTFPTYNGEKIVIRILDRDQGFIPLQDIGLTPRNLEILRGAIKQPHGIILISGPTGSGKSTTLYSMLSELDREHKNVLSLEDPIEYFVDGVIQSQVRPEIGYTFANGLRTTLRQDPDVIMVGEIRDGETAKLAIQAALTGHLVLSTIHTNDAVGAIPRLIDMGVEPYLIPPVLVAVVAQRLVRTFCEGAETPREITLSEKRIIDDQLKTLPEKYRFPLGDTVYDAQRTPTCPTGMRGRLAVFEVLQMSREIERITLTDPVDSKIWDAARAQGMLTMREDAIMKAFDKKIPFSEVSGLSSMMLEDADEDDAEAFANPAAAATTTEKTETETV